MALEHQALAAVSDPRAALYLMHQITHPAVWCDVDCKR
jgi:hypothetical protein